VLWAAITSAGARSCDARVVPAARLLALWGRREPRALIHLEGKADRDALWCLFASLGVNLKPLQRRFGEPRTISCLACSS